MMSITPITVNDPATFYDGAIAVMNDNSSLG